MKKRFLFLLKILLWVVGGILGAIALYFLAFWVLASLPATSAKKQKTGEVAIFVRSDDFHTEFVLPTQTEWKDWTRDIALHKKTPYLAFGWGDRGFYLGTPNESDFQTSLALKALFYLGTSVVHIAESRQVIENEQYIKLWLTASEYKKLVQFIENSFRKQAGKLCPIQAHPYGKEHYFFEAKGSYSLFYTCNTWIGEGLKTCQQPTCVWTPFASGILYFLR